MEPQTPTPSLSTIESSPNSFSAGALVIYALHGKCKILSIEDRIIGGSPVSFYKLEPVKSALSRSTRQEPHIWLPVSAAKERGMRSPMSAAIADECMKLITSREYFFSIQEPWSEVQSKFEASIRLEGAQGLAKVLSYLHALKRRQVVLATEALRLQESVQKTLVRELSEALNKPVRSIEDQITRGLRHKLIPDS